MLVDLGHVALSSGETDAALPYFEQAREREPGNTEALPALVEVYRRAGRLEDGLAAARELSDARPDHVVAALDVLDLALDLDRLDDAEAACQPGERSRRRSRARRLPPARADRDRRPPRALASRSRSRGGRDARRPPRADDRRPRLRRRAGLRESDRPSPSPRPSRRRSQTRAPSTGSSTWRTLASEAVAPPKTGGDVQWTKCPSCDAFVYHKRLRRNMGVCPECNHHFRLPVATRLELLLDEGTLRQAERRPRAARRDRLHGLEAVLAADRGGAAEERHREGVVYGTASRRRAPARRRRHGLRLHRRQHGQRRRRGDHARRRARARAQGAAPASSARRAGRGCRRAASR